MKCVCHGGTKLPLSQLSDGESFLYCNNMFGVLFIKTHQFFKRIQWILKKLLNKTYFAGNILSTIQCIVPIWGAGTS